MITTSHTTPIFAFGYFLCFKRLHVPFHNFFKNPIRKNKLDFLKIKNFDIPSKKKMFYKRSAKVVSLMKCILCASGRCRIPFRCFKRIYKTVRNIYEAYVIQIRQFQYSINSNKFQIESYQSLLASMLVLK